MAKSRKMSGTIPKKSGGVTVEIHPEGMRAFLQQNKPVRDLLVSVGNEVAGHARATASEAEKGPGGKIDGYAAAGFAVVWDRGVTWPRVKVISLADSETYTRAMFHTWKRDGIPHLRAALAKVTR